MKPSGSGLLGCLIAWPLTCWSQSSVVRDNWACTVEDARPLHWLARSPGATILAGHERFLAAAGGAAPEASLMAPGPSLEFKDHLDYVARVRALRAVSVVRLWNSHNTSLFLGVDRRGVYGIHLRREDPREGLLH
jgi:hypothetical protein